MNSGLFAVVNSHWVLPLTKSLPDIAAMGLSPQFHCTFLSLSPQPSKDHHKLTCYYFDHNRNPRLILSPIKTELVFLRPKLYVFHDLLTEAEMDRLKELAEPRVSRTSLAMIRCTAWCLDYKLTCKPWPSLCILCTRTVTPSGWNRFVPS